jgi:hypothetical protein
MPPELVGVLDAIEDRAVWRRVVGLNGARMEIRFCCNSETVRRVLVQQIGRPRRKMTTMKSMHQSESGMPRELIEIRDRCEDADLWGRVSAFNRGKFDIVFECGGFGLEDVLVGDVS